MRILLFVSQLWNLTGGEINTRDWAFGLKARGHKVTVYTPLPGPLAQTVRNAGIAVVDDPALINTAPDIIFGSGINELVALSARFPEVPAVQVAQQWNNWAAFPSLLPQVVLYMAVDEINHEMLVNEFGVAPEKVKIVHNSVDLDRIPPRRRPLPPRPGRALMFVKAHEPYVDAVRAACDARRITLDCIGYGAERVLDDPLAVLVDYDLVIGSARTAIEGSAAGAATLVADHRGLAGLLTTADFDRFRTHNFGREVLTRPLDADTIGAELDRYDPADAAAVSKLVRESASLQRQLDELEQLFSRAIALFRQTPPAAEETRKALSSYLSRHLPRFGEPAPRHLRSNAGGSVGDEIAEVSKRLSLMEADFAEMRQAQQARHPGPSLDDSRNLLKEAERLDEVLASSGIATFELVPEMSSDRRTYRIAAAGGEAEHYIACQVSEYDGALMFSLDICAEGTSRFRLQLLNNRPDGVYGDFDLGGNKPTLGRIGTVRNVNGGATAIGDGWHRVWIGATLPPGHDRLSMIVQLADAEARLSFAAGAESVLVRRLRLEFGGPLWDFAVQTAPSATKRPGGRARRSLGEAGALDSDLRK